MAILMVITRMVMETLPATEIPGPITIHAEVTPAIPARRTRVVVIPAAAATDFEIQTRISFTTLPNTSVSRKSRPSWRQVSCS